MIFLVVDGDITRSTMNSETTFTSQFCAQEFVTRLTCKRGRVLRFWMLVEKRAVDGSNTSPDFEPAEATQNIVEIRTVPDPVTCFGNVLRFQVVEQIHT